MALSAEEIDRIPGLSPEMKAQLKAREGSVSVTTPQYVNPPQESFTRAPTPSLPLAAYANPYNSMGAAGAQGAVIPAQGVVSVPPNPNAPPREATGDNTLEKQPPLPKQVAPRPAEPEKPQQLAQGAAGRGGGGYGGPSATKIQADYRDATLANVDEQIRNVENRREHDVTQAGLRWQQMDKDQTAVDAADANAQAEHKRRSQTAQAAMDDLNAKSDALAEYKEDPNSLWHNMNTGQKILGALALVAGAASPDGRNRALETLNRMQDKDIEAQRAAFNAKKESVGAKRTAFAHMMELYKDEDQAAAALHILQIDQAARRLELMTAGAKSGEVQLKANEAITALNQERATKAHEFEVQAYHAAHAGGGSEVPPILQQFFGKNGGAAFNTQFKAFAKRRTDLPPDQVYPAFINELMQAHGAKFGAKPGTGTLPRGPLATLATKSFEADAGVEQTVKKSGGMLYRGEPTPENPLGEIHARGENIPGAGVAQAVLQKGKRALNISDAVAQAGAKNTVKSAEASLLAGGNAATLEDKVEATRMVEPDNPAVLAQYLNEIERQSRAARKGIRVMKEHGVGVVPGVEEGTEWNEEDEQKGQ
jgi:hypothetical protein